MSDISVELDEIQLEEDVITRDNIESLRTAILKIEEILKIFDDRLKALE